MAARISDALASSNSLAVLSGMVVNVPLYTDLLNTTQTPESLQAFFADYYANEPFVKVMPLGAESEMSGFLSGNHLSGYDGMQIYITGNENRIQLSSVFDNLGKGASFLYSLF